MGEQEGAAEIKIDQALPFGEGQLVDPCAGIGDDRAAADGVDQDVDPAEFLLDRGLIDAIVPRKDLKQRLSFYLDFLTEGHRQIAALG